MKMENWNVMISERVQRDGYKRTIKLRRNNPFPYPNCNAVVYCAVKIPFVKPARLENPSPSSSTSFWRRVGCCVLNETTLPILSLVAFVSSNQIAQYEYHCSVKTSLCLLKYRPFICSAQWQKRLISIQCPLRLQIHRERKCYLKHSEKNSRICLLHPYQYPHDQFQRNVKAVSLVCAQI